jgi:hypothetical protein
MKEYDLLYDIINSINTNPTGKIPMYNIKCTDYNLSKPYSYLESIGVAIIKIHNDEEKYIEKMKREEDMFKNSEDRIAFIYSGKHLAKSTYNKFNYTHATESISNEISRIVKYAPEN